MESKKIQIKEYISSQVNVFVEPMVYAIVKARPANPLAFAITWLKEHAQKSKKQHDDSDSQEQEKQTIAELEAKIQRKKQQGKSRSRIAISEEVFGNFNKRQSIELRSIPKSQQNQLLIRSLIRNSILFQNVDSRDEQILIRAMEEINYTTGQTIIRQGQNGDELFVVESGQYDCSKVIDGQQKYLKTYKHGEAFGELALMYNAPRAATIVCNQAGKLYKLDRNTFSQVVKGAAAKKRELFKRVLDKIQIFASINTIQRQQFLDILKEERYESGQYVIKQGEQGNKFYIVLEGHLVAQKTQTLNELPRIVYKYKEGQYFGQLALLHDVNRQASVRAVSSVRVAFLDRESFKRIFGSMEEILKRNQERYQLKEETPICA